MPRMSKKLKKELAFFLNDRGAEATMNSAGNATCAGFASYPFVGLLPENLSESLFHLASQSCIIEPATNRY